MVVGKRSDFYALKFMPEAVYGVDPGIVAAPYVDGASETYKLQANATYAQFIRLAEAPSGMPKTPLVDVPQVFASHDYDTCKILGIRGDAGEFSCKMNMHGAITDYGTSGNTARLQPPTWLRLASSACGTFQGSKAGEAGGAATTVASATDADTFVLTAGAAATGHVVGVDGPGTGTDFEIIRPTYAGGATIFRAVYSGVNWGLSATPAAADPAYYACQSAFDKRLEEYAESFTFLLMRPNSDASLKMLGARCRMFEGSSSVGEIPSLSTTFIYNDWDYVTKAIDDEPAYIEDLVPCAKVSYGAKLWLTWDVDDDGVVDAADRKVDLDVSSMTFKWEAGYVRRKSLTAVSGISEVLAAQPGKFEMSFECIYDQGWQDYVGLCCSEPFGSLAVAYWEPQDGFVRTSNTATRRGAWYLFVPRAHLMEDPGSEGAVDGIMSQTIRLGAGDWTGDGEDTGLSATVAAGSDGVNVSTFAGAGTLNVNSTAGFSTVGEVLVATASGPRVIRYTGTTGTTFTGCHSDGAAGVLATGGAVRPTAIFRVTNHVDTIFQLGVV
jgi:hypothetical protein